MPKTFAPSPTDFLPTCYVCNDPATEVIQTNNHDIDVCDDCYEFVSVSEDQCVDLSAVHQYETFDDYL